MKKIKLNYAEIIIEINSKEDFPNFFLEINKNHITNKKSDIIINIEYKKYSKEHYSRDTFSILNINKKDDIIEFHHVGIDGVFNIETFKGNFFVDNKEHSYTYLLEFILVYSSPFFDAFFIHASSTSIEEFGIIGTGVSESGKSTLAKCFRKLGGITFHEELTFIRRIKGEFYLFSLPLQNHIYVVNFSEPKRLTHLFFLGKTKENYISNLSKIKKYQEFFKVIFSYSDFNSNYYNLILNLLEDMIKKVNISRLNFNPQTLTLDILKEK